MARPPQRSPPHDLSRPKASVGALYRILFKAPLLLKGLDLRRLIPRNILILTTRGRRTGRRRQTPMEFSPGPAEGGLLVMSGWAGNTDWYKNARLIRQVVEKDRSATRVFSRWSEVPMDGSEAACLAAARSFPSLYLRLVKPAAG